MIRVIIADDHPVVRRGLRALLEEEPDIRVVEEAATGAQALDAALKPGWDLLISDLSMPELSGLELIDRLRRHQPNAVILVLSMHGEEEFALRALQAGAMGYVTKESAAEELVQAVRAAVAGEHYISKRIAEKLAGRLAEQDARPAHERLSAREFQVMCLLAGGQTTSQIAESLVLSPKTVATYRARVMEKMGTSNLADIARYAVQHNLVK